MSGKMGNFLTAIRNRISGNLILLLTMIALLLAFGWYQNPHFLSSSNVINMLSRASFVGIIALGMTFVITSGGLDLSVGAMAAMIGGVTIIAMNAALPMLGPGPPVVIFGLTIAVFSGVLAGFANGILITQLKIEAFIVTLATMGAFRSTISWLTDGGTLSLAFELRNYMRPIYFDGIFGLTWPILFLFVATALCHLLLTRTVFGRHCAASGSNPDVAHYSNVNVARTRILSHVFLGALVGAATVLVMPRLGTASASSYNLLELEAIAAVIIGGTLLSGGSGRVWGTLAGVIILNLVDNILSFTDFLSSYFNGAIQGAVVLFAVVMHRAMHMRRRAVRRSRVRQARHAP